MWDFTPARTLRLLQDSLLALVPMAQSRHLGWRKVGIWDKVLAELQRQGDTLGEVQWTIHYVDGTVVRAHRSAAGAKSGTHKREVQ